MKVRTRLVDMVEFKVGKKKYLVINVNSNVGIDRVVVENKDGIMHVRATGHSHFEFSVGKTDPGKCDFWLANRSWTKTLEDYLDGRFWGQFTFGKLADYKKNQKLKKLIRVEIQKLADEFETKAARRLNGIVKRLEKKSSS